MSSQFACVTPAADVPDVDVCLVVCADFDGADVGLVTVVEVEVEGTLLVDAGAGSVLSWQAVSDKLSTPPSRSAAVRELVRFILTPRNLCVTLQACQELGACHGGCRATMRSGWRSRDANRSRRLG